MLNLRRSAKALLISLVSLPLGACAGFLATETKVPAEVVEYAKRVPAVENDRKSACWQQRQIAKQQAFLRSTIEGKEVIRYTACGGKESSDEGKPKSKKLENEAA